MSASNTERMLSKAEIKDGDVVLRDEYGYTLFGRVASTPSDGTAGYTKGCLLIVSGETAGAILKMNVGTSSSCNFDNATFA